MEVALAIYQEKRRFTGDFSLDRSIRRSPATARAMGNPGLPRQDALEHIYTRSTIHRSLSSIQPNEAHLSYYANTYDPKQLGNPIGVALATNRLTHGCRRYTGKYPRCFLGYIPCIPSKAMG